MKLPRLLPGTAAPIAFVLLILAGVMQLRAQFWMTAAVCIARGMSAVIFSRRPPENSPFAPEEIEAVRPSAPPALDWLTVLKAPG